MMTHCCNEWHVTELEENNWVLRLSNKAATMTRRDEEAQF